MFIEIAAINDVKKAWTLIYRMEGEWGCWVSSLNKMYKSCKCHAIDFGKHFEIKYVNRLCYMYCNMTF